MIYGHGDDIYNYDRENLINFSTNISPLIDNRDLYKYLCSTIDSISSYPHPEALPFKEALANYKRIGVDTILCTNGAIDAIYTLAEHYRDSFSQILSPTFSDYKDACMAYGAISYSITSVDQIDDREGVVWICNPNNPTGSVISRDKLLDLLTLFPNKIFIIDTSYSYFTKERLLDYDLIYDYPNLIFIGSMTKSFSIPGLRLGYIVSNERIISKISLKSMPWRVNSLAINAGVFLIDRSSKIDLNYLLNQREVVVSQINTINSFTAYNSSTHFFIAKTNRDSASKLKEYLVNNHSILIRDASNFEGLDSSYFRIAVRGEEDNNKLIYALRCWTQE